MVPFSAKKRRCAVKIAVSSTGPSLEDLVDPRFGRCSYYLIVDPETFEFEAVENQGRSMQ